MTATGLPSGSRARRQRRAKRIMVAVAVTCGGLALSAGAQQLIDHGLAAFIVRQPGIGATAALPDDGSSAKAPASRGSTSTTVVPPSPHAGATGTPGTPEQVPGAQLQAPPPPPPRPGPPPHRRRQGGRPARGDPPPL